VIGNPADGPFQLSLDRALIVLWLPTVKRTAVVLDPHGDANSYIDRHCCCHLKIPCDSVIYPQFM